MAKRTPGLQTRSQFHGYWGQFQYDTSTPPATFAGRTGDVGSTLLPNAASPLSASEFDKLEAGDTASTIDAITVVDGTEFGLWTCINPGTVGVGGAVWVRMDNMSSTQVQTIRDAHRIVVGIEGTLTSDPAVNTLLNLWPYTAGVSADFIDPADGSGLALALAAATALSNYPADIRLTSGEIDLDNGSVTGPFVLPYSIKLIGAGSVQTIIRGTSEGDQTIFRMGRHTTLESLSLVSPAPTGTITGTSLGIIQATGTQAHNFTLFDVQISLVDAVDRVARVGVFAIADSFGANKTCSINRTSVTVTGSLGATAGISIEGYTRSSYSDIKVSGADFGIRLHPGTTPLLGNEGNRIANFNGYNIRQTGVLIETDAGAAPFYGIAVSDVFIRFDDANVDPQVQSAIFLKNDGILDQANISGVQAHWGANAATPIRALGRISTGIPGALATGLSFFGCGATRAAPGRAAGLTAGLILDASDTNSIVGSDSGCDLAGSGPLASTDIIQYVTASPILWEHSHPKGLA